MVDGLLKQQFRPEFLNRLDDIVFYKPLTKDEITRIVDLMIADLQKRLEEKQLTVELTQAAKDYVVDSGYDPVYGARPLRRFLQSKVETAIAKAIISRDLRPRTHLVVDYNGRELAQNIQMSFATQDIPCASVSKGFPASGLPFGDKCAFRAASHTAARPACALFPRAA